MNRWEGLQVGDPVRVFNPDTQQFIDARFEAGLPDDGIKAEVKGYMTSVSRWYSSTEWKRREEDPTIQQTETPAMPPRIQLPRELRIAGHGKKLIATGCRSWCGDIHNGVSFRFEGEGGWVVDFDDLKQLVADIEQERKVYG